MSQILKNRMLSGLLVLAVWVTSLCVLVAPSHACCQKETHQLSTALANCCLSHMAPMPKADPELSGSGGVDFQAPTSFLPGFAFWEQRQKNISLTFLNNRHVPDQSNRHQELSVWLN